MISRMGVELSVEWGYHPDCDTRRERGHSRRKKWQHEVRIQGNWQLRMFELANKSRAGHEILLPFF